MPRPTSTRPRRMLPTLALGVGIFLVMLDVTAVSVALPAIGHGMGVAGFAGLQWVADGYTITFAALLLSAGALADRWGPGPVLLVGLALFTLTSACCGLAPTLPTLVAARALQGVAAALVMPASLAVLRRTHATAAERTRAISGWAAAGGGAAMAGPVVGGLLTATLGWRSVFFANVPVGLLGLWLTWRHIRVVGGADARHGLDVGGQLAATAALGALVYGLIDAGNRGWSAPVTVLSLAVSALAGILFVTVEWRGAAPALPLGLLRHRGLSGATVIGMLLNIGFYGQLFVITFYFQRLRGWSALATGFALLPLTSTVVFGNAASSRMMARFGTRPPMATGLTVGAIGSLALFLAGPRTSYPLLVPSLVLLGFGTALTMPAVVTAVVEAAPERHAGVAGGLLNASRQVGSAIGVALLGALVAQGASFMPGMRIASLTAGGSFALGALISVTARRRRLAPAGEPTPGRARIETAARH